MSPFLHMMRTFFAVFLDALAFIQLCFKPTTVVAAENLFLRKQLALFVERKVKPRLVTDASRFTLARLSSLFDWRDALTIVKPDTLTRWPRKGFRLFWKWESRSRGRPRIPEQLQRLIAEMATNNPTWGEERIADELLLKILIRISPRTVQRYMPKSPQRPADPKQRWMTFVPNHANAIIACDFFVVAPATFQLTYVFLIMEIATRRLLHFNVSRHPTADWTLQQLRECVGGDEGHRFVIHDRDSIYSKELDVALKTFGLSVLRTPYKSPRANSFCERLIGTARRECLDFMIPINEAHIRQTLKSWKVHYNAGRPHSSLGPRTPDRSSLKAELQPLRHCIPTDCRVVAKSILGGLHHDIALRNAPHEETGIQMRPNLFLRSTTVLLWLGLNSQKITRGNIQIYMQGAALKAISHEFNGLNPCNPWLGGVDYDHQFP